MGPPTPYLFLAASSPHHRRQQRVFVAAGTITTRSHTGMIITGTTSHIGVSHTGSHHRGDIVVVVEPTEEAITRTRVSGDLLLLLIVGNRLTRVGALPTRIRIIGDLLLPTRAGDLAPPPGVNANGRPEEEEEVGQPPEGFGAPLPNEDSGPADFGNGPPVGAEFDARPPPSPSGPEAEFGVGPPLNEEQQAALRILPLKTSNSADTYSSRGITCAVVAALYISLS